MALARGIDPREAPRVADLPRLARLYALAWDCPLEHLALDERGLPSARTTAPARVWRREGPIDSGAEWVALIEGGAAEAERAIGRAFCRTRCFDSEILDLDFVRPGDRIRSAAPLPGRRAIFLVGDEAHLVRADGGVEPVALPDAPFALHATREALWIYTRSGGLLRVPIDAVGSGRFERFADNPFHARCEPADIALFTGSLDEPPELAVYLPRVIAARYGRDGIWRRLSAPALERERCHFQNRGLAWTTSGTAFIEVDAEERVTVFGATSSTSLAAPLRLRSLHAHTDSVIAGSEAGDLFAIRGEQFVRLASEPGVREVVVIAGFGPGVAFGGRAGPMAQLPDPWDPERLCALDEHPALPIGTRHIRLAITLDDGSLLAFPHDEASAGKPIRRATPRDPCRGCPPRD